MMEWYATLAKDFENSESEEEKVEFQDLNLKIKENSENVKDVRLFLEIIIPAIT